MGLSSSNKVVVSSSSSSLATPCTHLRAAYHDCFNRWYSEKFSKGQWDKQECVAEWDKYRSCLAEHLQDKHLRSILLGAEASTHTTNSHDADGDSRQ